MLGSDAVAGLRGRLEADGYLSPDYGGHCFDRIPGTVGDVLGVDGDVGPSLPGDVFDGVDTDVDNVVCLLLDGFGLEQWDRHAEDYPFFERLADRSTVTPLTAIYPSETAAAMTTLHTGQTAAEHGLIEWNVYVPETGDVVQPLPYTARDGDPPAEMTLFEGDPVYPTFGDAGVESVLVQPNSTLGGPFSARTTAGARTVGCRNVAETAVEVRRELEAATDPTYLQAYVPEIDSLAHAEGTDSDGYEAQLAMIAGCFEREFARLDDDVAENTLLLVTADHGHVDTDPAAAVDLWSDEWSVSEHLERRPDGTPVGPTGSGRQTHLHVRDGHVEAVRDELSGLDALVLTGEDVLERGLLGPGEVSALTRERLGDVVIIHRREGVWYSGEEEKIAFVGQHGGLTLEEMLVPLAATRLDRL